MFYTPLRNKFIQVSRAILLIMCFASSWGVGVSYALPPLGLTLVDPVVQSNPFGINLSVIDESAYISVSTGVWRLDDNPGSTFVPIEHSQFGSPVGFNPLTQVIMAFDGEIYVAANFVQPSNNSASALFRLDSPTNELVTWLTADYVAGVDRDLRTLGRDIGEFAADFRADGSIVPLGVPTGCAVGVCESSQYVVDVTEIGFALGEVAIPGTIGTGPGLWAPDGSVTVLLGGGLLGGNIADRLEGNGVNVAIRSDFGDYRIRLGDSNILLSHDGNNNQLPEGNTLVAQSDFVVLSAPSEGQFFGYYPGIVPNDAEAAVNLFDIFPELAAIDIQRISDTYAVNNRIYMTVHGIDGLFLFGAHDPSVMIPEPTTSLLASLATLFGISRRTFLRKLVGTI